MGLKNLTQHVVARLKAAKFRTVFETDLERVWPVDELQREKRAAQIQAYAKKNGWSVVVNDPGMRVTFRKLP